MKHFPWKRYAVTLGIGSGAFLLLMLGRGGFAAADPAGQWRAVSDALFIPGILMTSFGLLLLVADEGVFDMLKFGVMKVFSMIRSEKKRAEMPRTYYDYRVERSEKPKVRISHLVMTGLFMMALAGIALAICNGYEPVI